MRLGNYTTGLYIFILVVVITIIIYSIYLSLETDRYTRLDLYNELESFPTIKMKDLPDPKFTIIKNASNCDTHISPCNSDSDCMTTCKDDKFKCRSVENGENIVYNNIKVGTGKWCLPEDTEKACGKYTGRSVWSSDSISQGWKCECLYPSLFDGPYCLNNKSCKDQSPEAKNISQDNSSLINSKGDVYDPNIKNFTPPDGIYNPFSRDKDGKRIYSCRCGIGSGNTRFIKLQNDPYFCHLEPCSQTHTSPLWDETNQTCLCGVDSPKNSDGTCVYAQCPYGSWNGITQKCECDGNEALIKCNSNKTNWENSEKYPKCSDNNNPLGLECINRNLSQICNDNNISNCGGTKGFPMNEFNSSSVCNESNKKCIFCIGGENIYDDKESGRTCCQCPQGLMYSNGYCIGSGSPMGYMCLQSSCHNIDNMGAKFFWVLYNKTMPKGCKFLVAPILYSKEAGEEYISTKNLPGWWIDNDIEPEDRVNIHYPDALAKCGAKCLSKNPVTSYVRFQNILNYLDYAISTLENNGDFSASAPSGSTETQRNQYDLRNRLYSIQHSAFSPEMGSNASNIGFYSAFRNNNDLVDYMESNACGKNNLNSIRWRQDIVLKFIKKYISIDQEKRRDDFRLFASGIICDGDFEDVSSSFFPYYPCVDNPGNPLRPVINLEQPPNCCWENDLCKFLCSANNGICNTCDDSCTNSACD